MSLSTLADRALSRHTVGVRGFFLTVFISLHQILVAALRISSVAAGGISCLDLGSNQGPLHGECGVSATGPLGRSQLRIS